MNDRSVIWPFVLSALAIWRLTHLFAKEDGPWDFIFRLRSWLGSSFFGRLMDCFYCLSLWFAFPFALWITRVWIPMLINWLALSGAATLAVAANRPKVTKPATRLRMILLFMGLSRCVTSRSIGPL